MFKYKGNCHQEPDTKPCKKCENYRKDVPDCEYCSFTNSFRPFKRKKKKTGCETPEYRCSTMPPVAQPKRLLYISTQDVAIKTFDSISIKFEKDKLKTSIEFGGLSDASQPILELYSHTEDAMMFDQLLWTKSLSPRDMFVPGVTMCLSGIFEDLITGELFVGEYDVLNYKLTKKENANE